MPAARWGVLVQGLPQEQLALSLLVMLAQQRRFISVQTQTGPLKLITELLDRAQESLHLVRRGSASLSAASGRSDLYPQTKAGADGLQSLGTLSWHCLAADSVPTPIRSSQWDAM